MHLLGQLRVGLVFAIQGRILRLLGLIDIESVIVSVGRVFLPVLVSERFLFFVTLFIVAAIGILQVTR